MIWKESYLRGEEGQFSWQLTPDEKRYFRRTGRTPMNPDYLECSLLTGLSWNDRYQRDFKRWLKRNPIDE